MRKFLLLVLSTRTTSLSRYSRLLLIHFLRAGRMVLSRCPSLYSSKASDDWTLSRCSDKASDNWAFQDPKDTSNSEESSNIINKVALKDQDIAFIDQNSGSTIEESEEED
ncbi:6217_t:CDS:2, partial [Scutellospora calospora]